MARALAATQVLFLCLVTSLFLPSSAQSCASYTFPQNRRYSRCKFLRRLGSSLHWNYYPSNATVDVAYRAAQSADGWIAWGINGNGNGNRMVGTQALVAFRNSTTGSMTAYTTPVSSYTPSMQPGDLSFTVPSLEARFSGGVMTIFATLQPPSNRTRVNHVWQQSTTFSGGFPGIHPLSGDNVNSYGSLDFLSG